MHMTQGGLIRKLLPFDENTDSNDQSRLQVEDAQHQRVLMNVADEHGLSGAALLSLRDQAVDVRALIRVKMADDADLKQAAMAVSVLGEFTQILDQKLPTSKDGTYGSLLAQLDLC